VDESLSQRLGALPAATLYEAAGKLGDMGPEIRQMVPGVNVAGPAFTIKSFPGDTAVVLRAIDQARPGDVLVIDAGGTPHVTVWGGTSAMACQARGIAGVVTNAAVRDLEELIELGFPVFARCTSVRGTVKNHPGWTGIPVSVGGVVVRPGDLVRGDMDGVVVIPAERLAEVLAKAEEQRAKEEERDKRVRAGESLAGLLGL